MKINLPAQKLSLVIGCLFFIVGGGQCDRY